MPVVHIFGMEIERKTLFIGGAVIAGAVALIVWLRARAASQAADAGLPAPQDQAGAGGGMTVAAPSGQVADQYQQQLDNSQLEAQKIANDYQRNLVTQQQKAFDFQQSQMEALAPAYQAEAASQLAVSTHYNTALSKAAVSCPGNASLRTAPDGTAYCRQKTSGGVLGIPVGDIFRTIQGFVGGVEAAAPTIGYNAAQDAARYYTGKVFPTTTSKVKSTQQPSADMPRQPTPFGTPPIAPHGYGELI